MFRSHQLIYPTVFLALFFIHSCSPKPDIVKDQLEETDLIFLDTNITVLRNYLDKIDFGSDPNWHLFPAIEGKPDSLKRLGLPVHGRWVTTWVNQPAFDYINKSFSYEGNEALSFPAGSFIVKDNYRTDPKATSISPDQSQRMVRTFLYKPNPELHYCATAHLEPYNGEDCYGGDWFYGFYFFDTLSFMKEMNKAVNSNIGSFCINCHAPAYDNDYVRTLQSDRRMFSLPGKLTYCEQVVQGQPATPEADINEIIQKVDQFCQADQLSPTIPPDVPADPTVIAQSENGAVKAQLMFDCFAWQTFIALNWPNKLPKDGKVQRGEADSNAPFNSNRIHPTVWETYKATFEVFQPNDKNWDPKDQKWNQKQPGLIGTNCATEGELVLTMTSKSRDVPNETGQAFAGSFGYLIDQDSQMVRYEVLFNKTEFEYLIDNGRATTKNLTPSGPTKDGKLDIIRFPDNRDDTKNGEGSIEIKSAWKKVCIGENCNHADGKTLEEVKSRFLVRELTIYDEVNDSCYRDTMALVGLHITRKTYYAPQWVWMTFEHKDNVPSVGSSDEATFYNPDCVIDPTTDCWKMAFLDPTTNRECCPNVDLNRFKPGWEKQPNQLTRLIPIEPQAQFANNTYQNLLASYGSSLSNYVLVSAQWPLHGRNEDGGVNQYNCADNGVSGDCYTMKPRFLRNTVIESYMSTYCMSDNKAEQFSNRSCMSCHGSAGTDFSYIWLDAVSQRVPIK